MRFLFSYFFLCASRGPNPKPPPLFYKSLFAIPSVRPRPCPSGPPSRGERIGRQRKERNGLGAKLDMESRTPSRHCINDQTTPSPRGIDRFSGKKCRFNDRTRLFSFSRSRWASWRWSTRSAGSRRPRTRASWRSSSLVTPDTPRSVHSFLHSISSIVFIVCTSYYQRSFAFQAGPD